MGSAALAGIMPVSRLEVHIEKGPVIEWVGCPLGVVKGIAGQTKLKANPDGSQNSRGYCKRLSKTCWK
ncbi:hypothetical protein Bca52824_012599 [Brassica carinata]|uniref:Uncharacterized protein n=1 Tax=Brassica carinata TaxID=52824 RepID=A0A8X7VX52_BRACI|nr:hypothetical protein Bca52824_012599 [Brassica carinata]